MTHDIKILLSSFSYDELVEEVKKREAMTPNARRTYLTWYDNHFDLNEAIFKIDGYIGLWKIKHANDKHPNVVLARFDDKPTQFVFAIALMDQLKGIFPCNLT